jgi:hypothetical protein
VLWSIANRKKHQAKRYQDPPASGDVDTPEARAAQAVLARHAVLAKRYGDDVAAGVIRAAADVVAPRGETDSPSVSHLGKKAVEQRRKQLADVVKPLLDAGRPLEEIDALLKTEHESLIRHFRSKKNPYPWLRSVTRNRERSVKRNREH